MNPKLETSSLPYLEGDWRYLYLIKVKFHANLHLFYSYRTLVPINSFAYIPTLACPSRYGILPLPHKRIVYPLGRTNESAHCGVFRGKSMSGPDEQ